MALKQEFETQGQFLFRYRGQLPVVLFLVTIPVIYFTDYVSIQPSALKSIKVTGLIISCMGLLIRAYTIGTTPKGTSGRNREHQVAETLNCTGIYSMVRHPLYVGNFLMWMGLVVYVANPYFAIIVTLAFWLYYERIMYTEERFLEQQFGETFLDWSNTVPAFIPSFRNCARSKVPFSLVSVLRREYSGFLATVVGFVYVDVVRDSFMSGYLYFNPRHYYVLGSAVVITLVLRTLKHHTRLLHEKDRS